MPKIYDQKQDPDRDMKERPTLSSGAPDRAQNRTALMVIVAILAVFLIVLFYRMARGEDILAATGLAEPSAIITALVG